MPPLVSTLVAHLLVLLLLCCASASGDDLSCDSVCSNAGDGVVTVATDQAVNTYHPAPSGGPHTANSSGTKILADAERTGGGPSLGVGDLVFIVQMQGASIDTNSTEEDYGDGPHPGGCTCAASPTTNPNHDDAAFALDDACCTLRNAGHLNDESFTAGKYEFNRVAALPGSFPGEITMVSPLQHTYVSDDTVYDNLGSRRYQIVRTPEFLNFTVPAGVSIFPLRWDGRSGGVTAINVANTLTNDGNITASGYGFRGGRFQDNVPKGNTGGVGNKGFKGEGIAGTPSEVYSVLGGTEIGPNYYPPGTANTDRGPGAPGTGGAAGDGNEDAAGGGGGNVGRGGRGGRGGRDDTGGVGGGSFPLHFPLTAARLTMGGGGGSSNGDDLANLDLDLSSGQTGGGLTILRARRIAGSGSLDADGESGGIGPSEGSGGGGAGGSVLISTDGAKCDIYTITARGGQGGSTLNNGDGGGGGGGGGMIRYYNCEVGTTSSGDVSGGARGTSTDSAEYQGYPGDPGIVNIVDPLEDTPFACDFVCPEPVDPRSFTCIPCSAGKDTGLDATYSAADTNVNTYWSLSASQTSAVGDTVLPVDESSLRGVSYTLQFDDLVMVHQTQGAEINDGTSVAADYGDGSGGNDRFGHIGNDEFRAGRYEYVHVIELNSTGLYLRTPLKNSYRQGSAAEPFRVQVVYVPQFRDVTVEAAASLAPLAWDGSSGGILAINIARTLQLDGSIDGTGRGFRGGAAYAGTDNLGYKGEGIAGTPGQVHSLAAGTVAATQTLPGSDRGQGAPGNAGGAGATNLDGGGGGGLARAGSAGGAGSGGGEGGIGGAPFPDVIPRTADELSLGGGGGGASGAAPVDTDASSGAAGGGLLMVLAARIEGTGSITSNGDSADLSGTDTPGGGGGGSGGSVLIYSEGDRCNAITVTAKGGAGGSSTTRANTGGGGAGAGGLVVFANCFDGVADVTPSDSGVGADGSLAAANAGGGGEFGLFVFTSPSLDDVYFCDFTCANKVPIADPDFATTPEDTSVRVNILANDFDVEGPLEVDTLRLTSQPDFGSAVLDPSGNTTDFFVTYTPPLNFFGNVSFLYEICDNSTDCTNGTVSIEVTYVNDLPTAADDAVTTLEDIPISVDVQGNDFDVEGFDNSSLTFPAQPVGQGTATASGGQVLFTPDLDWYGVASFLYVICDTDAVCVNATLNVTVVSVNDPPRLSGSTPIGILEDTRATIPAVVVYDPDIYSAELVITVEAFNGTVDATFPAGITVDEGDGVADTRIVFRGQEADVNTVLSTMSFIGDSNYNGPAAVTVTASDQGQSGTISTVGITTFTVDIVIFAVNDVPVAEDTFATLDEDTTVLVDVTLAIDEVEGLNTSSITILSGPSSGTAVVQPGGLILYTPSPDYFGPDDVRFTVFDSDGALVGATLNITVTSVNDAPVITTPASPVSPDEDVAAALTGISVADVDVAAGTGILAVTLVSTNATMTLGTVTDLTFSVPGSPTGTGTTLSFTGTTAAVNAALASLEVTGDADYFGPASVAITVDDQGNAGSGGTLTANALVPFTIISVNDAPVITLPGSPPTLTEETAAAITGISVADVDVFSNTINVTLSSADLVLTLGSTTGIAFSSAGNTNTVLSFSGTLADVNAALSSLSATGVVDFDGATSITVVADDLGNSGTSASPSLTDTETLALSVTNVLDIATVTVSNTAFTEGASNSGNALIEVSMSQPVDRVATVTCNLSPDTAVAGTSSGQDYTDDSPYTIVYNIGESGTRTADIDMTDDTLAEASESFDVTCTVSAPGADVTMTAGGTANVTVTDNDPFTVFVDSAAYSVEESAGPVTLRVNRTAGVTGAFTVDVVFSGVSATGSATGAGADFASATQMVSFGVNDASVTLDVTITDDTLAENAETFTATLSNLVDASGQGSIDAGASVSTVTIPANDAFTVSFSSATYNVDESSGPAVMTLVRTGGTGGFDIDVTFTDGSATGSGTDYTSVMQNIVFGANVNEVNVSVPINDDTLAEADETFTGNVVTGDISFDSGVGNGAVTSGGSDTSTVTIDANDAFTVSFSSAMYSVDEAAGNAVVTILRVGGTTGTFTVNVSFPEITATGSGTDYTAATRIIPFGLTTTSVDVLIPIVDDTVTESLETFTASLSDLADPSSQSSIAGNPTATVSIVDNDATFVTVDDTSSTEGVVSNDLVSVTLVGQADRDVNLTCTLTAGTAVPGTGFGEDYTDATFAFHFAPLQTGTQTESLVLTQDTVTELTEQLSVTCVDVTAAVSNVTVTRPTATVTILNDDATSISVQDTGASEGSGAVNDLVSVSLDFPADRYVNVSCTLGAGTAVPGTGFGEDYTDEIFTIAFAPGIVGPLTRAVTLTVDSIAELTETLNVTCSETTGGVASVADPVGVATITDDDTSVVTVLDTASRENATDNSLVSVTVGNPADRNITLECTLTPVTATTPSDYADGTFVFTYLPGETGVQSLDIALVDDDVAEALETLNVTCAETSAGVAVIADANAVASISPDDTSVITAVDASASEGTDATNNTLVSVNMAGVNDRTVTVSCSLTAGTATAGGVDYTDASPYLFSYAPGESGLKSLTVTLNNDPTRELSETFTVTCAETSGGIAIVGDATAVATIEDDDIVTLSVLDTATTEPTTTGNNLVSVTLGGTADSEVNITCWLFDGSARSGSDYANETLFFHYPAGDSGNKQQSVTLIDDSVTEDVETFTVRCAEVGTSVVEVVSDDTAAATVTDDDTTSITVQDASAAEESGSGNALVSVTLAGEMDRNVTIACSYTDGTAVEGTDYANDTVLIPFFAGEDGVTKTRGIAVLDDGINEATESFSVNCEEANGVSSTGVTWPTGRSATATITDPADLSDLVTVDVVADESADAINGLVSVVLSGPADRTITFSCSLTAGSAVAGAADGQDYTDATFPFTYAPLEIGARNASISLNNDLINEATEGLTVTCSETSSGIATVSRPSAVATITDNDATTIEVADTSGTESTATGNNLVSLTVTGRADRDINVTCTPSAGTAVPGTGDGEDYQDGPVVVAIPAFSDGVHAVDLVLNDDLVTEVTENLTISCVETSGGIASVNGGGVGVIEITDTDASSIAVVGGTALENAASNGLISLELTGKADRWINVSCSLIANTAVPGANPGEDYTDDTFTFAFAPFTTGPQSQNVDVNDDNVQELIENFNVTCTETSASVLGAGGFIGNAEMTIQDNDFHDICVVATAYPETSGAAPFVEATLSGPSDRTVTVDFTVTVGGGDTATAGDDLVLRTGTLTWPALTSGTQTADVTVVDDFLVENANETFTVTITNANGGPVINCPTATATIVENDYLVCGDGVRYAGEECDDGNLVDGDGCSSSCAIEPNAQCVVTVGSTSLCRTATLAPAATDREDAIHSGAGMDVFVILTGNDTWSTGVGTDAAVTTAFLASISGSLATANAYDSVLAPQLGTAQVTRVNGTHVRIAIPTTRSFAIDSDDTVRASVFPAAVFTSSTALTLNAETNFTIVDTGFTVAPTGSSLPCDVAGSSLVPVRENDTIALEVFGSTFVSATWANAGSAFSLYDSLGLTSVAETGTLQAHVLNADRPDDLVHPGDFQVADQRVVIEFKNDIPTYARQLAATSFVILDASAVSAGLGSNVTMACAFAWV